MLKYLARYNYVSQIVILYGEFLAKRFSRQAKHLALLVASHTLLRNNAALVS